MISDPNNSFGIEIGDTLIVISAPDRDAVMLALTQADVYITAGWGDEAAMIEDNRAVGFRKFRSFQHMPIFKKHDDYATWKANKKKDKANVVKLTPGAGDPGDCA